MSDKYQNDDKADENNKKAKSFNIWLVRSLIYSAFVSLMIVLLSAASMQFLLLINADLYFNSCTVANFNCGIWFSRMIVLNILSTLRLLTIKFVKQMTVQIDEENEDGQGHLVELRESTSTALKIIVERQTFYGMD